jgi:hypothetical protein
MDKADEGATVGDADCTSGRAVQVGCKKFTVELTDGVTAHVPIEGSNAGRQFDEPPKQ